jgi:hypothetical protein
MLRCWVETENGSTLELTQNSEYDVINIEGLNPVGATINTYKIGVSDGEHYNSSYINMRNIVLYIVPKVKANSIETNRLALYKYFRPKHKVRLYFQHDSRDVFIDGYVETVEIDLYTQLEQFQISIICPQPYFKAMAGSTVSFSQLENLFEFPFAIAEDGVEFSKFGQISELKCINDGEVETGLIITIKAKGLAYGIGISLDNNTNFRLVEDLQLNSGDTLIINTNRGEKSVTKIDSDGNTSNCINYVDINSVWLTLDIGEHAISKSVYLGYENIDIEVEFYNLYIGI